VDTWDKFKAPKLFFGASCSPLVDGDLVFLNVGGKGSSVVAFDRKKGDVVWQTLDDKASYSSPMMRGSGKSRELVLLTGANVVGLEPTKGDVVWKYPLVDALAESSTTPVQAGDILFATSITFGGVGLKADGKEVWKDDKYNSYFTTPIAIDKDHLYIVTCTKPGAVRTSATLRCVETATGKELWAREKVGQYHAAARAPATARSHARGRRQSRLLEPNTKEYKELARSKVCGLPGAPGGWWTANCTFATARSDLSATGRVSPSPIREPGV
jgi:outer membrane protein assembly factor BamB